MFTPEFWRATAARCARAAGTAVTPLVGAAVIWDLDVEIVVGAPLTAAVAELALILGALTVRSREAIGGSGQDSDDEPRP